MRIRAMLFDVLEQRQKACGLKSISGRLFVLALWLLLPSTVLAIDVSEYKWGFNGKVAPHRFNPLSVLINNPTPQQFTGEVRLHKSLGAGYVDAAIVEQVTISPNSSKWIQFYPYITSDFGYSGRSSENWSLTYPGGVYEFQSPYVAKYQRIILDDPNGVMPKGGALKFRLPDNLFPPFVTATDPLQLVLLDHVPRWEETRRQAFLDWVYLGGTVVLLQDPSGKFPDLIGPLAVLKTPLDDQTYGSGRVITLPMSRTQLTEDQLLQICSSLPKNYLPQGEKTDDFLDRVDETQQMNQMQNLGYNEGNDLFRSSSFLGQLREMTKPEHNWVLLHLMFWVYIALVFPGCYLLGKRWSDFRVVYAGLLGTVAVFSMLFSFVGRRGYGEATAVHTVAIAKPLSDGQMDVSSWSNIFVTNGADYEIRHNGFGSLYSTCNDHEQVKGEINNGAEAVFNVDIPPFSNRELAMRTKIPYSGPTLTIESLKVTDDRLLELEISVRGLKRSDVEKQFALIGNTFYLLNWRDDNLILASEAGNVVGMLRVQEKHDSYNNPFNSYGYQKKVTTQERYTQLFDLLLSRSLSVSREKDAERLRLPPNLIRVLLYSKITGEFAVQNKRLGSQEGQVLYCITLPATESKHP